MTQVDQLVQQFHEVVNCTPCILASHGIAHLLHNVHCCLSSCLNLGACNSSQMPQGLMWVSLSDLDDHFLDPILNIHSVSAQGSEAVLYSKKHTQCVLVSITTAPRTADSLCSC